MKRRGFLVAGAAVGGGLLVGCGGPAASSRVGGAGSFQGAPGEVGLNGWVRIAPDDRIVVALPRSEMGQGVHTALAMLLAEELDADWSRVVVEPAPLARIYANTAVLLNVVPALPDDNGTLARLARSVLQFSGSMLSLQITGGSSSVRDAWEPMRLAGASARALLVQAAAARWGVPATECRAEQSVVSHAGSGRTLRYGELAAAAAALPVPERVAFKEPRDYRLIGRPVARKDLPEKVNGRAVFGIDVRLPGMLYAALRQCPVFGGRLKSFDAGAARAMRGVKDVFALGDQAVVVLADRHWRAQQALQAVSIAWDDGPHAALDSAAISAQLRRDLADKSGTAFRWRGDAEAALANAPRKLEAVYEVPFLAHAALEPVNCTAQVAGGKVTVWASTQVPILVQWAVSFVADVDMDAVTVHVPYLGGGFGRRLEVDMAEQAVAVAMQTGGAPVQLLWSREEDFQHDMYRPAAVASFAAALDERGLPLAWLNRVAAPAVLESMTRRLLPDWLAFDLPDKNHIEGAFELPYAVPNLSVRQIRSATPVPVGWWRSVGHSYNAFFTECFVDELAQAAGQDPLAYRRALLAARPLHLAVLDLAAAQAGWGRPLPAGRARGVALHESFGSIVAQVAEVSIDAGRPRVHRVVCAIDCGTVVNPDTVAAQMQGGVVFGLSAALFGRITLKAGRVEQRNFPDQDVLRLAQTPVVETHIVASTRPPGGVGEPGTPPIAPAVANALFALTGQRQRGLPLQVAGKDPA